MIPDHDVILPQVFLAQALAFYQSLMTSFEKNTTLSKEYTTRQIYLSLLYLGDISRYAALHSSSKVKDWSAADRYYRRAHIVMPDHGNSLNQVRE